MCYDGQEFSCAIPFLVGTKESKWKKGGAYFVLESEELSTMAGKSLAGALGGWGSSRQVLSLLSLEHWLTRCAMHTRVGLSPHSIQSETPSHICQRFVSPVILDPTKVTSNISHRASSESWLLNGQSNLSLSIILAAWIWAHDNNIPLLMRI